MRVVVFTEGSNTTLVARSLMAMAVRVNTGAFGELQALWAADNEPPGVTNTVGGVTQGRVVCRS